MPPPKTVQGRFTLRRTLAGIATAASKLDCVQIDGLVVLKIIKHSRDEGNPSEMVSGQLLGMDITQNDTTTLEVGASEGASAYAKSTTFARLVFLARGRHRKA